MKIAACLLTCNRPELTEITASSFIRLNPGRTDIELLHADGGSDTSENAEIAQRYGFRSLINPTARIRHMETVRIFIREVALRADWMLWLENDWESVEPLPDQGFFRRATEQKVETIRLFGTHKMRDRIAGEYRLGTKDKINWKPWTEPGWEWGRAHWGCGGTIIRTSLIAALANRENVKVIMRERNEMLTLRPRHNIMFSNGEVTTPGFML